MTDCDCEFDFNENGINKSLYLSCIDCIEPVCYELRVVSLDYDDPFDDIDRKDSKIQFMYTNSLRTEMRDNCEVFSSKAECKKRFNELVRKVKN